MQASLDKLLEDELLNQSDFRSVSLAIDGVPATLYPTGISGDNADPLAFVYGSDFDHSLTEGIDGLNADMRFRLPDGIQDSFQKRFPQGHIHSSPALLIASMLRKARSGQGALLFADRSETFSNYFLMVGGSLMLFNWFKTENEFDVLYHALNICQQHAVSEQEVQINLSGLVEPAGVDYRLLKEHFQKVDINFGLDFHKMGLGLSRVKRQCHLGLLNQFVCVS